ncbi:fumarylacetoacetate hydrolase family protein [Actinosynnema sp. NPDC023587]|uniref:2-keto-4-pentenoate hydratase n=1 Tax=Actinosynnema sp. NPDC023587 TaxID=3154695 RepID=UPI0033EB4792
MENISTTSFRRAFDARGAVSPQLAEAADLLHEAGVNGTQVEADDLAKFDGPGLDAAGLDGAYAVQHLNIRRRIDAGAVVRGHKVGLTSKAMQEQLGVTEPDSGILLDRMLIPNHATVAAGSLFQARVEAEFGVVVGTDLAADDGPWDEAGVREHLSGTFLALEILDTRYPSWLITLWKSIADNASCASVVTGPVTGAVPADRLKDLRIDLLVDGVEVAGGAGEAVLGDPIRSVVWLAERLRRSGLGLHRGDLVITGAVHASVGLDGASEVRARSGEHEDVGVRLG